MSGEDSYQEKEINKVKIVQVKRRPFLLSTDGEEVYDKGHDHWELDICKRFTNDPLIEGNYQPYYIIILMI